MSDRRAAEWAEGDGGEPVGDEEQDGPEHPEIHPREGAEGDGGERGTM